MAADATPPIRPGQLPAPADCALPGARRKLNSKAPEPPAAEIPSRRPETRLFERLTPGAELALLCLTKKFLNNIYIMYNIDKLTFSECHNM